MFADTITLMQTPPITARSPKRPFAPKTPSPTRRGAPMAEVLQPLAQPSSTNMLHVRTPSSDKYPTSSTPPSTQKSSQSSRSAHLPVSPQYRATAAAPIQPYAFQSTPGLRHDAHTASMTPPQKLGRGSGPDRSSGSTTPTGGSREDLQVMNRPHSVISLSSSVPDLTLHSFDTAPRASPERYRRASSKKSEGPGTTLQSSSSGFGAGSSATDSLNKPQPAPPIIQRTASEDSQQSVRSSETAKRYRRRSTANLEAAAQAQPTQSSTQLRSSASNGSLGDGRPGGGRPSSGHNRQASRDSNRSLQNDSISESTLTKPLPASPIRSARNEESPARSGDQRVSHPSPLSGPSISSDLSPAKSRSPTRSRSPQKPAYQQFSPAAQHLAALSDKDLNKGMKSRLRRAFSFGSAAELRKASVSRHAFENVSTSTHHDSHIEEMDPEQQEIVRKQEAAGFGAGIYRGQGGFSGSTDNLSISSTASSASVMLRKMGNGVKKGGRSLKGLFRPKSVIGIPAADGPLQPSVAEVSMVTVEAERQRVNVNVKAADQAHGGTGFPRLERNSIEGNAVLVENRASAERNDSLRKSIVGSEKDRAEVLAAVKKGILKRSVTSSPQNSPMIRPQTTTFREEGSNASGSPTVSMPGTPKDERKSRSLSSTNSSNDYFSPRLNLSTRSMPATPQSNRNISFSPRIQFHDVWSSTEYDRRGEIATCNRLTPVLAQQIKEELNSFKMEMEVHEMSKPHTHFF